MNTWLFITASPSSLAMFLTVVVVVCCALIAGAFMIERAFGIKFTMFLLIWVTSYSALVQSGLPKEHLLPVVPVMFAAMLVCAVGLGLSPWGKQFTKLPVWMLAAFQGFRLPLEIVLHSWSETGTVPQTMTWSGSNYDIVSGIAAVLCLVPAMRNRKYVWAVNIIGIILLINVIRVVIMSSPFPFAWDLERPILLILYLPYAMIAYVCVWAAVFGHVVLTRALSSPE